MLTFDASDLHAKLIGPLQGSERRIRAAVATALTKTAVAVRDAERREMVDVFDRPTPYTLNALYLSPATAAAPEARVGVKDTASGGRAPIKWLRWHIEGGLRTLTGFEKALVRAGAMDGGDRAVPGKFARLNGFGNVSTGQMQQIFSQLRIETGRAGSVRTMPTLTFNDTAQQRKATQSKIKRAYTKAGGQFVAFPYGRGKLRPGLYLVRQFAAGRAAPRPIMMFVSKAEYEAERFDFGFVARSTIARVLPAQLAGQLARSLLQSQAQAGTRVSIR